MNEPLFQWTFPSWSLHRGAVTFITMRKDLHDECFIHKKWDINYPVTPSRRVRVRQNFLFSYDCLTLSSLLLRDKTSVSDSLIHEWSCLANNEEGKGRRDNLMKSHAGALPLTRRLTGKTSDSREKLKVDRVLANQKLSSTASHEPSNIPLFGEEGSFIYKISCHELVY